jgi:hypothetical protein
LFYEIIYEIIILFNEFSSSFFMSDNSDIFACKSSNSLSILLFWIIKWWKYNLIYD